MACQTENTEKEPVAKKPKVEKITVANDFVVEHLYSPSENKKGSWVAMTFDDKGRMIVSDQYGALYRLEMPEIGSDTLTSAPQQLVFPEDQWENDSTQTKMGMGYAQGLLWAFNSLYVVVNHNGGSNLEKSSGLYRLRDTDNDDQFDEITQLKTFDGHSGEHGPHSIVLAPDGQSLYLVLGNHVNVPQMDSYLLPSNWNEDNLLQRITDPRGHATDRMAPGGFIVKTDSLGKNWQFVAGGFRNTFDITFNNDGELFAYDSDMEWDFGMPWYRPTRLLHVTKGAEFGWRTGNSKWATYYPDNLPSLLNIGQGSPTNLMDGGKAKFPDNYRNSLFAFDWSFGIIYSVHLKQQGASYTVSAEEFLSGVPLPLTDGEIGPDGALYFLTGGRRLDSDLYRVSYKNRDKVRAEPTKENEITDEMAIRRKIENHLDHAPDSNIVNEVWPYLNHNDRHVRYAATAVLMQQPVTVWGKKAFREKNIRTVTHAMLAMAKTDDSILQPIIFRKLMTINFGRISKENKIALLRAVEVALYRMGNVEPAITNRLAAYFSDHYPANDNALNRELSKILIHIEAPYAAERTVALLENSEDDSTTTQSTLTSSADLILRNPDYGMTIANTLAKTPPAQQIYFATALSKASAGWTPELYERYFSWFHDAFGYNGGNSYVGFVDAARKRALEKVPDDQREHYNVISGDSLLTESGKDLFVDIVPPKGPGRNWKIEDALKTIEEDETNGTRSFENGKSLFAAVRCASCHTVQGEGGAIGPDLTQLGTRFSVRDMLTAIIKPGDVISDQYGSKVFVLKDGTSIMGRLISEDDRNYSVSQNPYAPQELREIPKKEVTEVKESTISIMPPGTLNVLNPEELKDLMAYLMAGGNEDNPVYKK